MGGEMFFIVEVRPCFRGNPYVTFWRPGNAGYCYPLPWAGRYNREEIEARPSYYAATEGGMYTRFPVPCEAVESLGVRPKPRVIDGNVGPVLRNDETIRETLRKARWIPAAAGSARPRRLT